MYDFQGPYTIVRGRMMLGRAARYLPLNPEKVLAGDAGETPAERWDRALHSGCDDYRGKCHCESKPSPSTKPTLFTRRISDAREFEGALRSVMSSAVGSGLLYPNCNHHVAHCLNVMRYNGWRLYEMFQLWVMIMLHGRFCGTAGFLHSMGPFLVLSLAALVYVVVHFVLH